MILCTIHILRNKGKKRNEDYDMHIYLEITIEKKKQLELYCYYLHTMCNYTQTYYKYNHYMNKVNFV